MKIIFATGNKGKLREAQEILGEGFELVTPADLGITEDIEETGSTLRENSLIKARYLYERTGLDCFADDTGLEVDALDGAPGVYTARYAGDGHDFQANMDKLLHELSLLPDKPRTARFHSVVTLIKDGSEHFFDGVMEGSIADRKAGCGGFGYDPVFISELYPDRTLAELPEQTKNDISHRGKALRSMAAWLRAEKEGGLEIMAPAGNFECLNAAIQGGADSVYFGVGQLNMRSHSANNFAAEDLAEVVRICREHGVKSYLTLNICLYQEDLKPMRETLDAAKAAGVTAIIASDMAAISYCRSIGLEVHISTQLNVSNIESLRFYSQFADVVVLARELNLDQVKDIHEAIIRENICGPSGKPVRIEMFAHGALCMAVSGKCYLSLHSYGASANRGSCYQICRRGYEVTDLETGNQLVVDNKYIMSPKDLCTIEFMDRIIDSGVKVFKIEGRARSAEYVKRCASCYRRAADAVMSGNYTPQMAAELKSELAEVFNRGFWDGYYQGAYLGQWSDVYGSQATRRKVYCGKVTNWFDRIGVAEISVESAALGMGDKAMAIGATTGVVEFTVNDMRVNLKPVQVAEKGVRCSVAIHPDDGDAGFERLRRGDKIYIWEQN